jgi:allantoin racemase
VASQFASPAADSIVTSQMHTFGPIIIVNPNSSHAVTEAAVKALAPFRLLNGPDYEGLTITRGPATISTDRDVAEATIHLAEELPKRPNASAFVIACFSDPGLDLLRDLVPQPVFGLQEAAVLTAMGRADRFGVIALSSGSVYRHVTRLRRMGLIERMVGEIGLSGVSALEAGSSQLAFNEAVDVGRHLVSMGARCIVLGCAGFSPRRQELEFAIGVPVIDPVQAAGMFALAAVLA